MASNTSPDAHGFPFTSLLTELQGEVIERLPRLSRALLALTSRANFNRLNRFRLSTQTLLEEAARLDALALHDEILSWAAPFFSPNIYAIIRAALHPPGQALTFYTRYLERSAFTLAATPTPICADAGAQRNPEALDIALNAWRRWVEQKPAEKQRLGEEEDACLLRYLESLVRSGSEDPALIEAALSQRHQPLHEVERAILKAAALKSGSVSTFLALEAALGTLNFGRWSDSLDALENLNVPLLRFLESRGLPPQSHWFNTAFHGNLEVTQHLLSTGLAVSSDSIPVFIRWQPSVLRCLELVGEQRPEQKAQWLQIVESKAVSGDDPRLLDFLVAQGHKVSDMPLERMRPGINVWLLNRRPEKPSQAELETLMLSALFGANSEALQLAYRLGAKVLPLILQRKKVDLGPGGPKKLYDAWLFLVREQHPELTAEAKARVYESAMARWNTAVVRFGLVHGWRPPTDVLLRPDLLSVEGYHSPSMLRYLLGLAPEIGGEANIRRFRERLLNENATDTRESFEAVLAEFGYTKPSETQ